MDIDKDESGGDDWEEPEADEDDREAPSEQDSDEAGSKGESDHMERHSDECESVHTQTSPSEFGDSPVHARVLDYDEEPDHVTSLADEPAEEPHHEAGFEGGDDDDSDDEPDPELEHEDEHEAGEEENSDGHEEGHEQGHDEELEEAREDVKGGDEEVNLLTVVDDQNIPPEPAPQPATTSRPALPSHRADIGQELPAPSPPKPKVSKRGKHKDRQSRRHSSRSQEPLITETFIEDKIASILRTTLPNMLSGLFQEAMGMARLPPPQQAPPPAPIVEVGGGSTEPQRVIDQVEAVGVQGMEEDHVDGAAHMVASPSNMETSDNEVANVSIRSP